jgi:hypothetical protein
MRPQVNSTSGRSLVHPSFGQSTGVRPGSSHRSRIRWPRAGPLPNHPLYQTASIGRYRGSRRHDEGWVMLRALIYIQQPPSQHLTELHQHARKPKDQVSRRRVQPGLKSLTRSPGQRLCHTRNAIGIRARSSEHINFDAPAVELRPVRGRLNEPNVMKTS